MSRPQLIATADPIYEDYGDLDPHAFDPLPGDVRACAQCSCHLAPGDWRVEFLVGSMWLDDGLYIELCASCAAPLRRTSADISPIVDAWPAAYPESSHGAIGWYIRQEDGDKERIVNPVYPGDASRIYATPWWLAPS